MRPGLAIALLLAVAARARADEDEAAARALYREGVELYDQHAWARAREKFEQAYGHAKRKDFLYNIAVCYREAGEFAKALEYFQSYVAAAGPTALDGEKVRQQIADLEKLMPPRLTVLNTDVPARVSIDGAPAGQTPLSIDVTPGAHSILVEVGQGAERRELVIQAGQRRTLEFAVREPARRGRWAAIGVAIGAVAVAAVVATVLALYPWPPAHDGTLGWVDVK